MQDVSFLTPVALKRGDAVMLSTILGAKHYPELEGGITLLDIDMPDEVYKSQLILIVLCFNWFVVITGWYHATHQGLSDEEL